LKDERVSVSVTLPEEIVYWIDHMVKLGVYSSRSQVVEVALREKMMMKSRRQVQTYESSRSRRQVPKIDAKTARDIAVT